MSDSIQSILNNTKLNDVQKIDALKMISVPRTLKVVLIGDGGVGKTSYIKKLQNEAFKGEYIHTLGCNVAPVRLPEFPEYVFNVWDCAGDPQYTGLGDGYYVKADAYIIMYTEEFQPGYWLQQFKKVCPEKPIVMCRNKMDLLPPLTKKWHEAQNVKYGLQHSCISVKDGVNCLEPLKQIVTQLKYPYKPPPQQAPEPKTLFNNVLTQLNNTTYKCETPDIHMFQGERVVRKTIERNSFVYTFECKPEFEEFNHDPTYTGGGGGLHGRWTQSNLAGRLLVETFYNNGKRHGKFIIWDMSHPDGIQYSSEVTMYENGKRHGDSIKYFPSTKNEGGRVPGSSHRVQESKSYQNGLLHGLHTKFNKHGLKLSEKLWKNGMLDGSVKQWYSNGMPKSDSVYVNGRQIGKHTEWYLNGCLKVEGNFCINTSLPYGKWTYYHQDGYVEKIVERSDITNTSRTEFPILKTTTYFSSGLVV